MGLPCTIFDGECMERKRRRRGNSPAAWKGGRKRRSTWRLRRWAVLRRPVGAAVMRGCVGAEERCERYKRWCRTYIG
jgi:hypothetical protein